MPHVYDEIYAIVQRIPRGRVLTYGVISHMIGGRMSAQGVGWALKALGSKKKKQDLQKAKSNQKEISKSKRGASHKTAQVKKHRIADDEPVFDFESVPWQRVVNSQGGTSTWKIPEIPPDLQRVLLEAEGIIFDDEGKMDLAKYVWLDAAAVDTGIKKTVARTKTAARTPKRT